MDLRRKIVGASLTGILALSIFSCKTRLHYEPYDVRIDYEQSIFPKRSEMKVSSERGTIKFIDTKDPFYLGKFGEVNFGDGIPEGYEIIGKFSLEEWEVREEYRQYQRLLLEELKVFVSSDEKPLS